MPTKISTLRPTIIYICGPDGSGKSTLCRELVKILADKDIKKVTYRWMRFNHITAKLVNGLGHLAGLSIKTKYNDNVIVGYHHYYKSAAISWLYITSSILDTFLVYPFKIVWPILNRNLIVIDRFIYDILVDLMIDTGIENLHQRWPGKILRKTLPATSFCFFLETDIDMIRKRRPDTAYDLTHEKRTRLYKIISKDLKIDTIDNNSTLQFSINRILERIVNEA